MAVLTGFFRTLILLGALQGFILSGLLYYSSRSRQSNRILAVLIFLMALSNLNLYLMDAAWFNRSQVLVILSYIVPTVIVMPFGPLIYFYIRSYSDPAFIFSRRLRPHFYTMFIDLLPKIAGFIYIGGLILRWIPKNDGPWGNFIDQCNMYSDIPRWLSLSIYLFFAYRYLKSINKNSTIKGVQAGIRWMNQFVFVFTIFQVIWLAYLIPYVIPKYSNRLMDAVGWYPIYIPMSVLIYWLGIRGWMASHTKQQVALKGKSIIPVPTESSMLIIERLKKAMEIEKLWLNPALNLALLTKHTGIPAKTISSVLNQHLQKSFNEFINEYRISAMKGRMMDLDDKNLTIAALAYECGFNSQPTFQRAFKALVGESPTEFIQKRNNARFEEANSSQIRI